MVAAIFLGCPHDDSPGSPLGESAIRILQYAGLEAKKVVGVLQSSTTQLLNVARHFNDVAHSITTVISVYEEKETVMETRRAFKVQRHTLVTKRLAAIPHQNLRMLGLANSHWKLPSLSDVLGNLDAELVGYVKLVVYEAQERLKELSSPKRDSANPNTLAENVQTRSLELRPATGTTARSRSSTMDSRPDNFALIPIIRKFATPRLQADLPCFMVETRLRNRDFCGRQDTLAKLDAALIPQEHDEPTKRRHAAIYGMPGLGKSEIAIQWVFTRQKHFDAIFWIQADSESKLKQGKSPCTGR